MKHATTILVILTLVCQTALANVGSVSFCISKKNPLSIHLQCIQTGPDRCCESERGETGASLNHSANCEKCEDGKLTGEDSKQALSSTDRSLVKAPGFTALLTTWQEILPTFQRIVGNAPITNRAPPDLGYAIQQFADTVVFNL